MDKQVGSLLLMTNNPTMVIEITSSQEVGVLFGDMVRNTLSMEHRKWRRALSQEINMWMIEQHV